MDNNQVTNNIDNKAINPKTGSGYVSAGTNSMDFSIAVVLISLVVIVIGGLIIVFTNDDLWDEMNDISETINETIEEIFDDSYYEEDDYYDEDYYDDDYYE